MPREILLRLRKIYVAILTSKTAATICVCAVAYPCRLDEALLVARSAPQGAHYHANVIYMLP